MRVIITREARQDIRALGDWIAQDNPARARSFVGELLDAIFDLETMPRRFPLFNRTRHPGIRRRVFGNYRIFYQVRDTRVYVIHVIHAARDHDSLLDVPSNDR